MTKLINIKKTKLNQKVKFIKHNHVISDSEYPIDGFTGKVVEFKKDKKETYIAVELDQKDYEADLAEWDNCLLFNFPHDDKFTHLHGKTYSYSNVKVEVIK
jgi:hypothetical protein